jgi:hypothetical protein
MNDRIRQLYYECQDESQSTEQCYQKFAELIIQECANVAHTCIDDEWFDVGGAILDHFGVEE